MLVILVSLLTIIVSGTAQSFNKRVEIVQQNEQHILTINNDQSSIDLVSYKYTNNTKIFKSIPIKHHAFKLKKITSIQQWKPNQIIATIITSNFARLAVLDLSTDSNLKLEYFALDNCYSSSFVSTTQDKSRIIVACDDHSDSILNSIFIINTHFKDISKWKISNMSLSDVSFIQKQRTQTQKKQYLLRFIYGLNANMHEISVDNYDNVPLKIDYLYYLGSHKFEFDFYDIDTNNNNTFLFNEFQEHNDTYIKVYDITQHTYSKTKEITSKSLRILLSTTNNEASTHTSDSLTSNMNIETKIDTLFYLVSEPNTTWYAARNECIANGDELASIHCHEEHVEAQAACSSSDSFCYIGIKITDTTTPLSWSDGSAFDYGLPEGTRPPWLNNNEPHRCGDNGFNSPCCVVIIGPSNYGPGGWADLSASSGSSDSCTPLQPALCRSATHSGLCNNCIKKNNICTFDDYCCSPTVCYPVANGIETICCIPELNNGCINNKECCGSLFCDKGTCRNCLSTGQSCQEDNDCCGETICNLDSMCNFPSQIPTSNPSQMPTNDPTISAICGNNKNSGDRGPIQCENDNICCDGFKCKLDKKKCVPKDKNAFTQYIDHDWNHWINYAIVFMIIVNVFVMIYWLHHWYGNKVRSYEKISAIELNDV